MKAAVKAYTDTASANTEPNIDGPTRGPTAQMFAQLASQMNEFAQKVTHDINVLQNQVQDKGSSVFTLSQQCKCTELQTLRVTAHLQFVNVSDISFTGLRPCSRTHQFGRSNRREIGLTIPPDSSIMYLIINHAYMILFLAGVIQYIVLYKNWEKRPTHRLLYLGAQYHHPLVHGVFTYRIGTLASPDMVTLLCLDSGANIHATSDRRLFVSLHTLSTISTVYDAGSNPHPIEGIASIRFVMHDKRGQLTSVTIHDVRLVPSLCGTYINTTKLRRDGWKCFGNKNGMNWQTPDDVLLSVHEHRGNEYFKVSDPTSNDHAIGGIVSPAFMSRLRGMTLDEQLELVQQKPAIPLTRWEMHEASLQLAKAGTFVANSDHSVFLRIHHMLGHPSFRVTAAYCRAHKIPVSAIESAFCRSCLQTKAKKAARVQPNAAHKITIQPQPFERVSADVWGPIAVASKPHGHKYILMFADRATNSCWSYPMANLRSIVAYTQQWIQSMRHDITRSREQGLVITFGATTLKMDSATYFKSKHMQELLASERITPRYSAPHMQWQNGFAERVLQDCALRMKATLKASGLPDIFWSHAWQYCMLVRDYVPRNTNPKSLSPREMRGEERANIATQIHPFGSDVYTWAPNPGKLAAKADKGIYVGYDEINRQHIVVVESRVGTFHERRTGQLTAVKRLPSGCFDTSIPNAPLYEEHGVTEDSVLLPQIGNQSTGVPTIPPEPTVFGQGTGTYLAPYVHVPPPQFTSTGNAPIVQQPVASGNTSAIPPPLVTGSNGTMPQSLASGTTNPLPQPFGTNPNGVMPMPMVFGNAGTFPQLPVFGSPNTLPILPALGTTNGMPFGPLGSTGTGPLVAPTFGQQTTPGTPIPTIGVPDNMPIGTAPLVNLPFGNLAGGIPPVMPIAYTVNGNTPSTVPPTNGAHVRGNSSVGPPEPMATNPGPPPPMPHVATGTSMPQPASGEQSLAGDTSCSVQSIERKRKLNPSIGPSTRKMAGSVSDEVDAVVLATTRNLLIQPRVTYCKRQAYRMYPALRGNIDLGIKTEVEGLIHSCLTPVNPSEVAPEEVDSISTLTSLYSPKLAEGKLEKFKVRCVYKGQYDVFGVDYLEKSTNYPLVSTFRTLLALSPMPPDEDGQREVGRVMDVPQAFTLAPVEKIPGRRRILVTFPRDISPLDDDGNPVIYEVHHSIYGMKSAGNQWQKVMFAFLRMNGFNQSPKDPALWYQEGIRLIVWTDDTPYRATPKMARWFKKVMYANFGNCKDRILDWCLGTSIVKDPKTGYYGFHQAAYISSLHLKFNIPEGDAPTTPLPPGTRLRKYDDDGQPLTPHQRKQYLSMLGSLLYIATWSRPQLSYAASALGAVASAPTTYHMKMVRHALHYCTREPNRGIQYGPPRGLTTPEPEHNDRGLSGRSTTHNVDKIVTHSDASFAGESGYRSQSAFVIFMNGGPIHWSSVRQEFPALSSTEAEIMAGAHALRSTLHLRELLTQLGKPQGLTSFCLDNTNAIRFNRHERVTKRNLHIGVRYCRVRYHDGIDITLVHLNTLHMTADLGTKVTSQDIFLTLEGLMTQLVGTHSHSHADGSLDHISVIY